jgi:hypothetical protein
MPRSLPSPLLAAVATNSFTPCYLLDIALVSGVEHVWSGIGSVTWNGNTYRGVGSLGAVGDVEEGSDVQATGTSVGLSGIDSGLMNETLNDIQQGAHGALWLGLFADGAISCAYRLLGGVVDAPQVGVGPETFSIALALESKMTNLKRANNRRYTAADQRSYYPLDSGFNWVEVLNDIALLWG